MGLEFPEFQIKIDGHKYATGCLPRSSKCGQLPGVPVWDGSHENCPIVKRPDWKSQESHRAYEWSDNDQSRYPACTLASLANQGEFFLARMGRAKTNLDWLKAWRTLSGGYGGVALDHALRYVMDKGFPLSDGSGVLLAKEVWDIPNIDAAFSAPMRGVPLWFGASGHAECGMTVIKEGGSHSLDVRGTWDVTIYGERGWYPRSLSYINAGLRSYGAFAIREWELRAIDLK